MRQPLAGKKILKKNGHANGNGHLNGNGSGALLASRPASAKMSSGHQFTLEPKLLLQTHDHMVKARVLEERLIRMYKKSDGYFWLGGPGEEAFNIPLGQQIRKGQGLDYDFCHFHYRSTGILLTMGMNPMDMMRQMKNTATDPFSGGRNFVAHASIRKWNVVPITSTIETQYLTAIGSGIAQRDHGGKGITIVNGGDAGTAEGDFASCLIWATRPKQELPLLMIVTNNSWGISTPASQVHAEQRISDRGIAFGMKTRTINGNDVEESTIALREAIAYIRTERKPFLLEARVSRLYGHSSATGANFIGNEEDPLVTFESQLESAGLLTRKEMEALREKYNAEMLEMAKQVVEEPMPDASTIYDYTYCGQKGRYW
jgi:2-oxoisovalerate dehydrogenase E1 component alpha subunit